MIHGVDSKWHRHPPVEKEGAHLVGAENDGCSFVRENADEVGGVATAVTADAPQMTKR